MKKTISNIDFTKSILDDISDSLNNQGYIIEVDDKKMGAFINNLQETKNCLEYLLDYLSLAQQIQKSKKEIMDGKYVEYTLEEILHKLNAA